MTGRTGRRPGQSGTRDAILEAASQRFAELGYDRTTLRSVAQGAGVDLALVAYYFGSKSRLLVEAVGPPVDPDVITAAIAAAPRGEIGERLARVFAGVLEDPSARRRISALVRAAASEPEAAELLRDLVARQVLARVTVALGVQDAERRAALVASQLIGFAMARLIVGIEPLAAMTGDDVVAALAPTLQRYLAGPL